MTEVLFNPSARGPIQFGNSTNVGQAGQTTVASGDITAAVATAQANTGAVILLSQKSATRANSGGISAGALVEVDSIVNGTGFTLVTADGSAATRPIVVSWVIFPLS